MSAKLRWRRDEFGAHHLWFGRDIIASVTEVQAEPAEFFWNVHAEVGGRNKQGRAVTRALGKVLVLEAIAAHGLYMFGLASHVRSIIGPRKGKRVVKRGGS